MLIGGAILFVYVLFKTFEPQSPQDKLKEFATNLMHYEFGDGYEVMQTRSQNNHPDRPQDLVIKLTDEEFAKLKAYIDRLEEGEKSTKKNETIYVDIVAKREDGCVFKHTSTHADCDYKFFMATAEVDYQTKEVSFKAACTDLKDFGGEYVKLIELVWWA